MSKNKKLIKGAGGGKDGGGSSGGGVEASDTLQSKAFVSIVDVLCEGEIVGLVNGLKSVYFDNTPILDSSGNRNFTTNGNVEVRVGTQSQSYVPNISGSSNEVSVDVEIKYGSDGSIIRQITNSNIDRITARFLIPALISTDVSNGNTNGGSVSVSVWVKPDGGSYTQVASKTVTGKSSGRYEFSLNVPLAGDAPWSVKFQRDTVDSTSQYVQNRTYISSYTEISDVKMKFPNTALVALSLDAQQFSSIPSRIYEVDLLKIRVPTNYNDVTRVYTGTWDGTFQISTGACNNPAWVFYDLLTSTRYGLGKFISASQIDKFALYEIARYCDELVPDGFGGMEPRFTCNILIQNRDQAYNVLQGLASVFRGMIYWGAGSITATQDSPKDAAYLFTNANVIDGLFNYAGASSTVRHSVALVTWNDPDNFCNPVIEYVEDHDSIADIGIQEISVIAIGCTSRGQAHRLGKWILYTERAEAETVVFKTGLDGMIARPGQVIKVADDAKAGIQLGGRISTATTSTITIDRDLPGSLAGASLSVLLADGSIEERDITGYSSRVVSVSPAFSSAPNTQSMWVLKKPDVEPQTFRVISVAEDEPGIYMVTALRHDPDKFAAIEQDIILAPKSYSVLSEAPSAPQTVQIIETLYQTGSEVRSKFTISCDKVNLAAGYVFSYQYQDGNLITLPETQFNEVEILDTRIGQVTAYVYAVNAIGSKSQTSSATLELYGKTALPADVSGFSMIPNQGLAALTWNRATDLDVLVGGFVRIRHTPRTTGQAWKDGVDIVPALAGTANSAMVPLLDGTYMIKFVDSSGNFSETEAMIVTTFPDAIALNVVSTDTESPSFPGTLTNMLRDTVNNAIVLASGTLVDDIDDWDSIGSVDYPGGILSSGTYDFQNVIDLGGVWPTRIRRVIDLEAFEIGNLIDQRTTLIDDWIDIDGQVINDVNAELFVRTTTDNPSGSPTWTDWKSISQGEYTAWGFQFQLRCTSGYETHNLFIKELSVTLDVEDRTENLGPISSGAGSYAVSYDFPFFANPSIAITAKDMQSGDYWTITSETESGFSIIFKNAGGTAQNRNFYVMAKGYGRQVG